MLHRCNREDAGARWQARPLDRDDLHVLSALAGRRSCNSGLQVRTDGLAAAPRCLLTDVLLVLLLLELTHNSPAHIPDVLARLERNAVPLVQVLAVSAHLLDKHLRRLLVDVVERLFFVVGVRFGQG